jgi:hypothetical protein
MVISFKLIFTNYLAVIVILAFIGRLFTSIIKELYMSYYFSKEFPVRFLEYSTHAAFGSLILVPTYAILQAMLIDWLS